MWLLKVEKRMSVDFMVLNWKLAYALSIKNKLLKQDFQMEINYG
jgi:hypothetical protein